jgi:hypothetical protein|tara:strand:- start:488 stop:661 length:174 start_codon:yes stop_codon:yes gene_type:complete
MKLQEAPQRTSLSTVGLSGITILAGVVFDFLNPWWLIASAFLILVGVGLESGQRKEF